MILCILADTPWSAPDVDGAPGQDSRSGHAPEADVGDAAHSAPEAQQQPSSRANATFAALGDAATEPLLRLAADAAAAQQGANPLAASGRRGGMPLVARCPEEPPQKPSVEALLRDPRLVRKNPHTRPICPVAHQSLALNS